MTPLKDFGRDLEASGTIRESCGLVWIDLCLGSPVLAWSRVRFFHWSGTFLRLAVRAVLVLQVATWAANDSKTGYLSCLLCTWSADLGKSHRPSAVSLSTRCLTC